MVPSKPVREKQSLSSADDLEVDVCILDLQVWQRAKYMTRPAPPTRVSAVQLVEVSGLRSGLRRDTIKEQPT